MGMIVLLFFFMFSILTGIRYKLGIKKDYNRLDSYSIESINSQFGKMSYVESGTGESILISHGIFGGYDQGYVSLYNILGEEYRKVAPSRFGYPGSDLPHIPTPENQAKVFVELLNELGIEKSFIITTSAGGAAGIKMAIQFPERVKGLILLSSGMPTNKKSREEITGMLGPPEPLVNDFPMWFSINHFRFIMEKMFHSDIPDNLYETLLPVKPRKLGVKNDTNITNLDMLINYDDYPVEEITAPILIVHAKDDPMATIDGVDKFIERVNPQTYIYETGGHLITGHENEVSEVIKEFIEENSNLKLQVESKQ